MIIKQQFRPVKNYRFILFILLFLTAASMQSNAQTFSTTYNTGSYYTLDNAKHTGLIGLNPDPALRFKSHPDNILYFKQSKEAVKQTVQMSSLKGFVINMGESSVVDTFAIVHNSKSSRIKFKN